MKVIEMKKLKSIFLPVALSLFINAAFPPKCEAISMPGPLATGVLTLVAGLATIGIGTTAAAWKKSNIDEAPGFGEKLSATKKNLSSVIAENKKIIGGSFAVAILLAIGAGAARHLYINRKP